FTKACKEIGVVIHGTFILALPIETKETIEETIRYAMELDVFSIQVSLAAPYPGTELYEMARQNGWFAKKDKSNILREDGIQDSALEYPGLSKEEIYEAVEKFYSRYFFRPRPILRIMKTMLQDKDVFVRRVREGFEFFRTMSQRRSELKAQA
ncbi:MAG TPA: hopanoid biosynthesis associated radical SAM protein HpnJ, partial [Candidatus Kapabacteria bacterium]|nr:hopanoid biosynthesis associated radical SAM protein HpnJ [Candidatus Kapabacteria bacterium]